MAVAIVVAFALHLDHQQTGADHLQLVPPCPWAPCCPAPACCIETVQPVCVHSQSAERESEGQHAVHAVPFDDAGAVQAVRTAQDSAMSHRLTCDVGHQAVCPGCAVVDVHHQNVVNQIQAAGADVVTGTGTAESLLQTAVTEAGMAACDVAMSGQGSAESLLQTAAPEIGLAALQTVRQSPSSAESLLQTVRTPWGSPDASGQLTAPRGYAVACHAVQTGQI